MAIRTKTIEYAFPTSTATKSSLTRFDFAAIDLFIPETASRTFRSVVLEIGWADFQATAGDTTNILMGIKLGAAAFDDLTMSNPAANSAEHQAYLYQRNVTAYFASNFGAGGSQTCQVGFNHTGPAANNISAKLIITYEYDDAGVNTRIKTVRIPLDTITAAITAVLTEVGTNQIPDLDDFLPEPSKVYRNIFFELNFNSCGVGTTNDPTLNLALDAEAEHTTGAFETALASACAHRYIWVRNDMSPSAAHQFRWRASTVTTAATFNHPAVMLVVTYEYSHAQTTTTLTEDLDNSETGIDVANAANLGTAPFQIVIDDEHMLVTSIVSNTLTVTRGYNGSTAAAHSNGATVHPACIQSIMKALPSLNVPGQTTATDAARMPFNFDIPDAKPRMVQSGAMLTWAQTTANGAPQWRIGAQSVRSYTDANVAYCGGNFTCQRIDSGGAAGAAFTLAEGYNESFHQIHQTAAGIGACGFMGLMYLNYVARRSAYGSDSMNHTVMFGPQNSLSGTTNGTNEAATPLFTLGESVWFKTTDVHIISNTYLNAPTFGMWEILVECLTGEWGQAGFIRLNDVHWTQMDGENGWYPIYLNVDRGRWRRSSADPDTRRLDPEGSRRVRCYGVPTNTRPLMFAMSYCSGGFAFSGDVTGSAGGLVSIELYRSDTDELVATGSRTGNGVYSIPWGDTVTPLYAVAKESASLLGRSDIGYAA